MAAEDQSLSDKHNVPKQLLVNLSSNTQQPFEYPRGDVMEPQVMQFKTSQKLINSYSTVSRVEISQFYNSLTSEQKRFFTKYDTERTQVENELQKTKIQFTGMKENKKPENDESGGSVRSRDLTEEKLQKDLLSKGITINSKIPFGTELSYATYFALIKLMPQRHQRREKVLEFFGLEERANDLTILPPKLMSKFEQQFITSRTKAVKKRNLPAFEQEVVIFKDNKLSLAKEKLLSNVPAKETLASMSEISENDEDFDIPELEPVSSDMTEPLPKRSRLDLDSNEPSLHVNAETQTDLKMEDSFEFEEVKRKFKNLRDKIYYHKKKSEALKETNNDYEKIIAELEEDCKEMDEEVNQLQLLREDYAKLKQDIRERDELILELNDQLKSQKTDKKFFLKNKSGNFSVEAHTCFSRLISQGCVAQAKVGTVILVVAELFKITIDAVPSRWTVGRDIHMVQSLNCEYITKLVSECSNLSLLSDETTKFTKKLQGFVLTGKNDKTHENFSVVVGVSEVPTKSAERCLQEFKQTLSNIGTVSGLHVEQFINDVFINIRNLMGDQAATTKLFYSLFKEYRSTVLKKATFDDVTKASLERVNYFFCMLHILSNTSAVVFQSLLDHEKFSTNNEETTESTVLWVINETARAFAKRSSGKHRTASQWESLAIELNLKFSKIDSNIGHRFIIRFIIAAEILYNYDEIIGFLENLGNTDVNLLNLKNALRNDLILLHLHVLALLGSLILHPMWRLCEASESVLQMTLYAPALLNYLKDLVDDPMLLFTTQSPFDAFPDAAPKENSKALAFYKALKERPIPVGGSEVVPLVAKNMLEYYQRQLEPFVTGIYSAPDIALEKETAGAPLTNMLVESAFGHMDRLFATKPNMTTYNKSALLLEAKNHMFQNVGKLPEAVQREMYLKAFNNKGLSAKAAAEKAQQIHRENIETIEQEALKQQMVKKKKEEKRKKITVELRECGFWLSVEEMEKALLNIPPTTATKYVKSNIRFRKTVWSPNFEPKNLLQFTYQKHTYTYPELVTNLKAVIVADFSCVGPDTNYTSDSDED